MPAYYNEIDPKAAAWLRELIRADLIAPGDVDERDIRDVRPDELAGYTQCHFFAGIGVWSYALRRAGWPDDEPVWTGSCPCQPFSTAGKGAGFADERHLWPAWFHLVEQCRPLTIFGEQVASDDGLAWLDIVRSDLEGATYAVGGTDLCAAGFGAPHIRQRLFFVAKPDSHGCEGGRLHVWERGPRQSMPISGGSGEACELGDTDSGGVTQQFRELSAHEVKNAHRRTDCDHASIAAGSNGGVGNAGSARLPVCEPEDISRSRRWQERRAAEQPSGASGAVRGFWCGAEWIYCTDSKWRPVEPGSFPLAHGAAARVVRLRGYGNSIVAPVAIEFIRAYLNLIQ